MATYRVFGLRLRANTVIPHLVADAAAGLAADIDLIVSPRVDAVHADVMNAQTPDFTSRAIHESTGAPALQAWHLDREFLLRHGDGTVCSVDHAGTRISVTWPDHHDDRWEFVLSFIIAFALRQQGRLCLHAAAVCVDDAAVLLLGRPGAGKSTLAAGLSLRGQALITDDVAVVDRQGGSMVVQSGPRVIRPRCSALSVLGDIAPERRLPSSPHLEWLLLDPDVSVAPPRGDAVRVDTIYVLDPQTDGPALTAVPMAPTALTVELIADAWASQLTSRAMQARELEQVGQLVSVTHAERLIYNPREAAWVDRIAERILA